jgi:hypothetical protein
VRLRALLANGQWLNVPLKDNAYAVELPLAHLPARLVGYDQHGRGVGSSDKIDGFGNSGPTQAPGKAKQLLAVKGPHGAHSELLVGPATGGGQCMYVKHYFSKHVAGAMEGCHAARWHGSPLQLETSSTPAIFIDGRVRADVTNVRVVFVDGTSQTIHPTQGYVLATVEAAHQTIANRPTRFVALGKAGTVLGVEKLPPPPTTHR